MGSQFQEPLKWHLQFWQVKWMRILYSEFSRFSNDQEHLMSKNSFDYIEGFVIINRTGLLNNWRSAFSPKDPLQASQFISDGKTLYCMEIAKYFNSEESDLIQVIFQEKYHRTSNKSIIISTWSKSLFLTSTRLIQKIENLLSELSYIPSTLFMSEVSYVEFLDRVHVSEIKLRAKGLWEVPHPWLNLLIPKSKISEFALEVFGNILTDSSNGPILMYPVNKAK